MEDNLEIKKRGPKLNNPIKQEAFYNSIRTPEVSEGRCVKCGMKGELGDRLCLECWDKTTDEALMILIDKQYSRQ